MDPVQAVIAPAQSVDQDLRDAGVCGPELAHLGALYCDTPRALVFRSPSPDWRVLLLILPWASRLSWMGNPIFASLARQWGLGVRFIGIDRDRLVYDFRALLAERTLKLLIDLMRAYERGDVRNEAQWLDVLFDALATQMLTTLETRRSDWIGHLDREHRLESGTATSLFSRQDRHPDFVSRLRQALREHTIDTPFYSRVLRSIDRREAEVDTQLTSIMVDHLDPEIIARLIGARIGLHLGCYNWLHLAPRHAPARAHLLARLPWMAQFFAETLVPIDAQRFFQGEGPEEAGSALDQYVRQAVDGGQDRTVIDALARRLGVDAAVMRRLWREAPGGLGTPPAWLLPTLLQQLARYPDRRWPKDESDWQALIERASHAALAT